MQRKRILIEGVVQGVGFRPFVFKVARGLGLTGWVLNDARGVTLEVQGEVGRIEVFLRALRDDLPPLASISRLESAELTVIAEEEFVIRASAAGAEARAQIAPDTWVCPDCLAELFDRGDRRYRYPFINCTNCGPRYTIVTGIPYDRDKTTMDAFAMCPACRAEYDDPDSRRFHAQPNACPECGPSLTLRDAGGRDVAGEPVSAAVELLAAGRIVAVKGLGGYHLAVDACNDAAVAELRRRKVRDEKPFALMSRDIKAVSAYAEVGESERRLLSGPERPIVLLRRREGHLLSGRVAPGNRYFGAMLPYTPLHYLLLEERFAALVMTSANVSDEPIAYRDGEAAERLAAIADYFLGHDRPIHIRTDDSIARVMAGRPLLLRRSRGFVPGGIVLPSPQEPVLALGGELKNAVCLARGERAFLSQHVGDLKNPGVFHSFEETVEHLQSILEIRPQIVAHDLHPDYYSTRFAEGLAGMRRVAVQHHHAHLASCLAENGVDDGAIGVIFDGIGYGADGRIWGGEFLIGDLAGFRRAGHFAYAAMPGGDAATREPWRMALSYLHRAYGDDLPPLPVVEAIPENDRRLLLQMIAKGVNSPPTSSCGRLFDAVAVLAGLRGTVSYEGQAALELEMAISEGEGGDYPYAIERSDGPLIFEPSPMIRALVADLQVGATAGVVAARFHNTLARMIAEVCGILRDEGGPDRVAFSGGVFQNLYLTERAVALLEQAGFEVCTHSLVPPNDGGLALGQAVIAGRAAS